MSHVAALYDAPDMLSILTRPLFLTWVTGRILHTATYYVRLSSDSMQGVGLHDGDILTVDCSLESTQHDVKRPVLFAYRIDRHDTEGLDGVPLVQATPDRTPAD
jgi:hypothetical protein